jgi:eukaryotic-like serine/threonine-protein kinase
MRSPSRASATPIGWRHRRPNGYHHRMIPIDDLMGGRYRLRERIASGGMGEVWRARDDRLLRDVAVKVLRPEHADDVAFRARLRIEAQSAAAINCDNVVDVYDWGEQTDESGRCVSYIVMELVGGSTVAAMIARDGALSSGRTARVVADVAAGLAAAHARGLVHRDVKPANLLQTASGRIKIADFGIARAQDGAALTTTGTMVGTARYLAPEQVRGQSATAASDIYSLGIVAYQCLAGDVPFRGDGDIATATARLTNHVPPLPPAVPAALRDLVMAMLDPEPAVRPTAAQLAHATKAVIKIVSADSAPGFNPTALVPLVDTAVLSLAADTTAPDRAWWAAKRYTLAGVAALLLLVAVFLVPSVVNGLRSGDAAIAATHRPVAATHSAVPKPRTTGSKTTTKGHPSIPATQISETSIRSGPDAKLAPGSTKAAPGLAKKVTTQVLPGPAHGPKKAKPGRPDHRRGPGHPNKP